MVVEDGTARHGTASNATSFGNAAGRKHYERTYICNFQFSRTVLSTSAKSTLDLPEKVSLESTSNTKKRSAGIRGTGEGLLSASQLLTYFLHHFTNAPARIPPEHQKLSHHQGCLESQKLNACQPRALPPHRLTTSAFAPPLPVR